MANSFTYNDLTVKIGDTIDIDYKIVEGDKQRIQPFKGIVTKVNGATPATKTITVRKISNSGIGVEKIIPLSSPNITKLIIVKKSNYQKAKLYFLGSLSEQQLRTKLYSIKKRKAKSSAS